MPVNAPASTSQLTQKNHAMIIGQMPALSPTTDFLNTDIDNSINNGARTFTSRNHRNFKNSNVHSSLNSNLTNNNNIFQTSNRNN